MTSPILLKIWRRDYYVRFFLGCLIIYLSFASFTGFACGSIDGNYLGGFEYSFTVVGLFIALIGLITLGICIMVGDEPVNTRGSSSPENREINLDNPLGTPRP